MAFSAHPDDAELGCGGLLLLAAKQKLRTAIIDLTEGEASTLGTPMIRQREKEAASSLLGLSIRESLGMQDTCIGQANEEMIKIVSVIRKFRPKLVLAPYFQDRHPDHAATADLIKKAVFFAKVAKVGKGTPHRVNQILHYMLHSPFTPSLIINITPVWTNLYTVWECYKSQFFSNPEKSGLSTALSDGSFLNILKSRATVYGAQIHASFGEPYFSRTPLSFNSPKGLLNMYENDLAYGSFS